MTESRRGVLAWAIPAALVVAVSIAISVRQSRASNDVPPARFSGSRVILKTPSLLNTSKLASRVSVAIVRDEAAAKFYDSPATLDSIVTSWKNALTAIGAEPRVVSSSAIGAARGARVLVVPSSPCLTVATREAMDLAGSRGQGLIVTGSAGVKDAGCREIGYGLVVALTGATRVEQLEERSMVYVTIPYGGPLSADIPPGSRIDLNPAKQVALRLADRDAVYSDYSLEPQPVAGQPLLEAAIAHSTYRGARVVYWGFGVRETVARPWNRAVVSLLVRNSVAWTARLPISAIEPWPNNRHSATAFVQDVEDQFTNARYAADTLAAVGVPGTFFVISDLARRNTRLTRRLADAGEVGSHTENHGLLGGLKRERQFERLAVTQHDLTEILGGKIHGLRPPEEQFDSATMAGWLAAGGTYIVGANDSRCASPELIPIGRDTLTLLPRTGDDDFGALAPGESQNPKATAALLESEFSWIRELGGLYALSYHSQLLSRPEHLPALAQLARSIAADTTVWITTSDGIASWWRARSQVQASSRLINANRLDITVRNLGTGVVRQSVVRVELPTSIAASRASTGKLLPSERGVARVMLPLLPPRTATQVSVALGSAPTVKPQMLSSRRTPAAPVRTRRAIPRRRR
jgi:peptidoglycan/xylan/chitin deacetylase (PgdA/CDA1 family)